MALTSGGSSTVYRAAGLLTSEGLLVFDNVSEIGSVAVGAVEIHILYDSLDEFVFQ